MMNTLGMFPHRLYTVRSDSSFNRHHYFQGGVKGGGGGTVIYFFTRVINTWGMGVWGVVPKENRLIQCGRLACLTKSFPLLISPVAPPPKGCREHESKCLRAEIEPKP